MQSTPFLLPLSIIANGQTTGNSWTNPNNLLFVDGQTANSNPGVNTSSDITVGNFNFNIPQGSTINGIEFNLIGYRGPQTSPQITLTVYAEDDTSTVPAYYPSPQFTGFSQTLATYLLGSPSYQFATSFDVDQINNLKFNLVAQGANFLDAITARVFWTPSNPTPTPTPGGTCVHEIQSLPFQLAVELKSTDIKMTVKSFNLSAPQNTVPTPITMAMAGAYIDLVIDKGLGQMENTRVDTIIPLSNGFVDLFFQGGLAGRGLDFVPPYTSNSSRILSHISNAEVIISNDSPFYQKYVKLCDVDTVFSPPITAEYNDSPLTTTLHDIDLKGPGVTGIVDPFNPHRVIYTISGSGTTPPVVVGVGSGTSGNVQVNNINYNVPFSGVNRGGLVQISTEQVVTITSVTIGGVSASQVVSFTDVAHNIREEQWYAVAPPLGSQAVVITLSAPAYITSGSEALMNTDQATPIGTTQTASGSSVNPTLSLVTTYDNSTIFDGLATAMTPIIFTEGPGQVSNWKIFANADTRQGASSYEAAGLTPDTVNMQYTMTQNTPWVYTAVEIKGVTAALGTGITSINGDGTPAQILAAGAGITITPGPAGTNTISSSGGSGSGTSLESPSIHQVAHGLSVGNVIKVSGSNIYAKAQANNAVNSEAVGIVSTVVDADHFKYVSSAIQIVTTVTGTPGDALFLDPLVAGGITTTRPTAVGQVVRGLGTLITSGSLMYFDIAALGEELTGASSGNSDASLKVGVGAQSNTLFFNWQQQFTENDVSGNPIWTGTAGSGWTLQTPYLIFAGQGSAGITTPITDLDANNQFSSFNKLLIMEGIVSYLTAGFKSGWGVAVDSTTDACAEFAGTTKEGIAIICDVSGNFFTYVGNGTTSTQNPTSSLLSGTHVLRIEYDPANAIPQVRFYIDGLLADTITTDLPITADPIIFNFGNVGISSTLGYVSCPSFAIGI